MGDYIHQHVISTVAHPMRCHRCHEAAAVMFGALTVHGDNGWYCAKCRPNVCLHCFGSGIEPSMNGEDDPPPTS